MPHTHLTAPCAGAGGRRPQENRKIVFRKTVTDTGETHRKGAQSEKMRLGKEREITGWEKHKRKRVVRELGRRETGERKHRRPRSEETAPSELRTTARMAQRKQEARPRLRCWFLGEGGLGEPRLGSHIRSPIGCLSRKGKNNLERQAAEGGGWGKGRETQLDALLAGLRVRARRRGLEARGGTSVQNLEAHWSPASAAGGGA